MIFKKQRNNKNGEEIKQDNFSPIESMKRGTKNSIRRWKFMVWTLLMLIALSASGYGALSYASTPSFCANCHEITPQLATYEASAHNQIKCTQCHIKLGGKNQLLHKIDGIRNVYTHITAPPGTIVPTVTVSNENCEQCHSKKRLVSATGDLIVNHEGHITEGIPCVTCHSGVVHAKVVERGISDTSSYTFWTTENTKKLIEDKNVKPNMGTCIDCHEKVNLGKKPWTDPKYILPGTNDGISKNAYNNDDSPEARAGVLERTLPDNKQKLIFEAISGQEKEAKLSMECMTCHREINTPKNHDNKAWQQNHGDSAVKELEQCLNCHKDSLWIKTLEKQHIKTLLSEKDTESVNKDWSVAIEETRGNYFCSICHANRPQNHLDRNDWLYNTHRLESSTPEERKGCFVCHDNEKPLKNETNAPSDVYCDFCHEGLFQGEAVKRNS
ncbi:cytochrome C [Bacillus sp. FJAT-27225]|uniref:NapC/NirT family cytochrome c n=1 Tax=Bacillus sp. FJAT-27225 TaxID=1743144 RepID=UPI00080C2CDF|nr:NapC/NirT family cytochrome c [Bacillus sp. FJAT-27225]OCA88246.1 cytochrome C [Bacillus sp. FJAT-27225]